MLRVKITSKELLTVTLLMMLRQHSMKHLVYCSSLQQHFINTDVLDVKSVGWIS